MTYPEYQGEWPPRDDPIYGQPPIPASQPPGYPVAPSYGQLPVPVYPPYGQPPPVVLVTPKMPTSGMAVASMVLGIIGLVGGCCTFGVPSLLAVIFGHLGVNETRSAAKDGHGMAIAGLIMGYVLFAPAIVLSIWVVFGAGLAAMTPAASP